MRRRHHVELSFALTRCSRDQPDLAGHHYAPTILMAVFEERKKVSSRDRAYGLALFGERAPCRHTGHDEIERLIRC